MIKRRRVNECEKRERKRRVFLFFVHSSPECMYVVVCVWLRLSGCIEIQIEVKFFRWDSTDVETPKISNTFDKSSNIILYSWCSFLIFNLFTFYLLFCCFFNILKPFPKSGLDPRKPLNISKISAQKKHFINWDFNTLTKWKNIRIMIVLSRAFDKAPIGGGGLGKIMIGIHF